MFNDLISQRLLLKFFLELTFNKDKNDEQFDLVTIPCYIHRSHSVGSFID